MMLRNFSLAMAQAFLWSMQTDTKQYCHVMLDFALEGMEEVRCGREV